MVVISCSRRTDIPKGYSDWLLESLKKEEAYFRLPGRSFLRRVSLKPNDVHSLVFWSKDYVNFLKNKELEKFLKKYNLFFHFSITGLGGSFWEPNTPPAEESLKQLKALVGRWGPKRITWRFDPIVTWIENGKTHSNLTNFSKIASEVASMGIKDCVFSFVQWYPKVLKRTSREEIKMCGNSLEEQLETLASLLKIAQDLNLTLSSCASDFTPWFREIKPAKCIDSEKLTALHKSQIPAVHQKDSSQRKECGCTKSLDIGSYSFSCVHGCLYCYANPTLRKDPRYRMQDTGYREKIPN